jgi:hypothetical protein
MNMARNDWFTRKKNTSAGAKGYAKGGPVKKPTKKK